MKQKDILKRLNIEIPLELLIGIKELALCENTTIKRWVTRAIVDRMTKEKQYK